MKYSIGVVILVLLVSCVAKNQPVTSYYSPDYFILNSSIQMMDIDPLGHLYLVDDTDRVSKFDTTGQLQHTVVNNNLGRIHSLDVGNPFKVMVFYRDQQTIILYDRTLSEIQRIPLIQWELQDVTAACLSPDNALWIFNGMNKVLVKLNDKGDPLITSDPFDILRTSSARPDFIYDVDQLMLVKEGGRPIDVFNDFGNYQNSLPIENDFFSISNNTIVTNSGTAFHLYKLPGGEELSSYTLKEKLVDKRVFLFANQFYVFDDQGVFLSPIKTR